MSKYLKAILTIFLVLLFLSACVTWPSSKEPQPVPTPVIVGPPPPPAPLPDATLIEVQFATDREKIVQSGSVTHFGSRRSDDITYYGSCYVSVPINHKVGEIEAPWVKGIFERPDSFMAVKKQNDYKDFDEFLSHITQSTKGKVFIFVHGYNVTFENAALRTAQMAYDLRFQGVPIFFSWPSNGKVLKYGEDEVNSEWATPHIESFLKNVIDKAKDKDIYIIAHSMGTRPISRAVNNLLSSNPQIKGRIKEIVLAAPDIDAGVFKNQIMPGFSNAKLPVTMYTSTEDAALWLSSFFHGYLRVGSAPLGNKNLEVIDATNGRMDFLGHSYFVEHPWLLNDMSTLFENHMRADTRPFLEKVNTESGAFWRLIKGD